MAAKRYDNDARKQMTLRLPAELYRTLTQLAAAQHRSLQQPKEALIAAAQEQGPPPETPPLRCGLWKDKLPPDYDAHCDDLDAALTRLFEGEEDAAPRESYLPLDAGR
jgi:hypothetical protein